MSPMPSLRTIFTVGFVFSLFAAVVSHTFSVVSGTSLWTLQADATTTWHYALLMNLIYWNSWAALTPPLLRFSERFRIVRPRWRRAVAVHVAGGFLFVSAHVLIVATGRWWLQSFYGMDVQWWSGAHHAFLRTLDWELSFYWAVVGLSHALHYHGEAQARALRAAQLETRLVESQLEMLQRQLRPHFLFNTLHTVSSLMHRDVEAADLMLERLSDLLRLTLERAGVQEVPLKEELEFLDKYLEIEQLRFGDRLCIERTIDPDALDALVPTMIMQPLVENALRHGIARRVGPGSLEIRAARRGDSLDLAVRDNGPGLSGVALSSLREGIGLANTRSRLVHLYGGEGQLEIRGGPEGGLLVTVIVPFRRPIGAELAVAGDVEGAA